MSMSGLSIGLSALFAQRRGLEVTGQNIANAGTAGYTRQRVGLVSDGGPVVPAFHSRWNGAGAGVSVQDVQRLRNVFLESRGILEKGNEAQLRAAATTLSRVEDVLGEPGDAGIATMLAEFWSGFDDVANRPTDLAARTQLLERASTLAAGLNKAASRLEAQWLAARAEVQGLAQDVDATATTVAELNRAIGAATAAGLSPNDLADQRDVLVQRLAEMTGATVRAGDAGTVDVFLGGTALVRGSESTALGAVQGPTVLTTPPGTVRLAWFDGTPVGAVGGTAGGLLAGLNAVLPSYAAGVREVAQALVDVVNAQHALGRDLDGATGGPLLALADGRLEVAVTDPRRLAAAHGSTTGASADGRNALALAELGERPDAPDAVYRALVVRLGVESQTATRRVTVQTEISRQVDAAREAEAGVNLDEEMANMIAYQKAYEGAARYLTAVDQLLDTLVNRTGVVGR
jgi:flagellar hook-associated protein 1